MALDLGELSARVGLDIAGLKRDVSTAKSEYQGLADDAGDAGQDAGKQYGEGFKTAGKATALAAGAVVGASIAYGVSEGLQRGADEDKFAAQLGLNPRQQERLGSMAGKLYANAYGESFTQVTDAIGSVKTSLKDISDPQELRRATKKALDYATVFEVDVARAVQVAGQLVNTGLVKDSNAAFDILTASAQRVPSAVREDLLDAGDEYGQFFETLGFNGRQAFQILVDASADGMYGIDKAGDAIKEFTIRSTDMSTASKDAYKAIGLDAKEMANNLLAGGDDAKTSFDKIVDGLLGIDDPAKRANAAIALFGTPLEDLNVTEIPKFLKGLRDTGKGLDNVKGSAKEMGDTLNDNASTRVTAFKRKLQGDLIDFFDQTAIPFLENEVFPALSGIGDALDKVPSWAIKGSVGGLLGLMAAGKLGSIVGNVSKLRGAGAGAGLAGAASMAKPVPVVVTNPGFAAGGGGGGGGVVGGDNSKKRRGPGRGGGAKGAGGLLAATVLGPYILEELKWGVTSPESPLTNLVNPTPGKGGGGYTSTVGESLQGFDTSGIGQNLQGIPTTAADAIAETERLFRDAKIPDTLKTQIALMGVPESKSQVRDLIREYKLTPEQRKTVFELLGFDSTMGRIRAIDAAADAAARERRLTIAVQYANEGRESRGGLQQYGGTTSAPGPSGREIGPSARSSMSRPSSARSSGRVVIEIPGMGELLGRVIRDEQNAHDAWGEALGGTG